MCIYGANNGHIAALQWVFDRHQ